MRARNGRRLSVEADERRAVGLRVPRVDLLVHGLAGRGRVHLGLLRVARRRLLRLALRGEVRLLGVLAGGGAGLLLVGRGLGAHVTHLVLGAGGSYEEAKLAIAQETFQTRRKGGKIQGSATKRALAGKKHTLLVVHDVK